MPLYDRMRIGKRIFNLVNTVLGVKGRIIRVKFIENSKKFSCTIPDDQLFISVKDLVLLEEYELLDDFSLDNFREGFIVDAGAHVGLFSLKASTYAKKVLALEPLPYNYCLLESNLQDNNVKNVYPVKKALWRSSSKTLFLKGDHSANGKIINRLNKNAIQVCTTTLQDIIDEYGRIDLLKIDIEGAEFDVFFNSETATFHNIRNIVGEIHPECDKDLKKIREKLENSGYKVDIIDLPIFVYRYAIRSILRNFKKLTDLWLLKILVLMSYTIFDIFFKIGIISEPQFKTPLLLYASRKCS